MKNILGLYDTWGGGLVMKIQTLKIDNGGGEVLLPVCNDHTRSNMPQC